MLVRKKSNTRLQGDGEDWWKIEPKYSSRVLIGNWLERRKTFMKDSGKLGSSIYKTDFTWSPQHPPDQALKKYMMGKHEGLPVQHSLICHGEPRRRNLVSEYEDKYNRHGHNPLLPPLRQWNGHKLSWVPQKTDFPILEPPTNYGLYEHLMEKWNKEDPGVMKSVYTISYERPPDSAFVRLLNVVAQTHTFTSNQGHPPQNVSRILNYEGVRNICKPLANW